LEQHRDWVLGALGQLEQFMRGDADFRGNLKHELRAIGDQRRFIEDGKYRVVFLGTFNVGKSTAINAFLGGGYLPMDVEECTSRLTFIERGERQALRIELNAPVSSKELDALRRLLADRDATLEGEPEGEMLRIAFSNDEPASMCAVLEPLITVNADEAYPLLAPLREKIEELNLTLPSSVLQEDIAFVDTPGVHSVSDTRAEITYGIIERSHLVISFVDSSFAGNVHDLNFIKRIIKWRGRRVFFVLNKADKLENNEIDVRGARGPARALIEAFARHEIPEDSEIFFFSGYRALRAQQLEKGHLTLEEALDDNKLSLPTSVLERIQESDDPLRDLSAYLLGQSRFPQLKTRLVDYLVNENKAGAVVETASQFIGQRAADCAAPLETELELARDPSKFEALRANREKLTARLEQIRDRSNDVFAKFSARSKGGPHGGDMYPGYETQFRSSVNEAAIEERIVAPTLAWLRTAGNLKEARREKFKPLSAQLEAAVDEFVSTIVRELNQRMERDEQEARDAIEHHLGQVRNLRTNLTRLGALEPATLEASMAQSYAKFGAGGAVVGVAAGAVLGSVVPIVGTAIGAGLGGLLGAVGGLLARLAWSEESWLKRLEPLVRENAMNMLVKGGKDAQGQPAAAIVEVVAKYIRERSQAFHDALHAEVDSAINSVQREYDDLVAREDQIRRDSEAIIARLEPKVTTLDGLRKQAAKTIDDVRGRETVRV
jgi:GTP-binding protein EngB required for normal cell division